MTWWIWVVLWTALVACSAAFLGALVWRVLRRAAAAARELGELASAVETIEDRAREAAALHAGSVRDPAVFTPWAEARVKYREGHRRRRVARSARRTARRARADQPQRVSDLRSAP